MWPVNNDVINILKDQTCTKMANFQKIIFLEVKLLDVKVSFWEFLIYVAYHKDVSSTFPLQYIILPDL